MKKIVSSTQRLSPAALILILAAVQVLCATWLLDIEGFYAINSLLFLLSGLAISFLLLRTGSLKMPAFKPVKKQGWLKLLVVLILLPVSYQLSRHIMDHTPLQQEYADMLPIMKIMGTRFINGQWQQVYAPIPGIWNGVQPIYLPAMWLPFVSSLLFHFDMRWITVCGIWLSVLLCIVPSWKRNAWYILYSLAILTLLSWLHLDNTNNVIRLTEEGVVFFYYSLLIVAIMSRNPWLVGISAALCLLSRYVLIGWIPFAGLYLLFTRRYKYLWRATAAGTIILLLLVIIPFGWKPLLLHLQLPEEYMVHAARVWEEHPEYFYRSLGMTKFFGQEHIRLLHSILLGVTFFGPVLFLLYIKKKAIAPEIALLSGLQLCITLFYNFLDVSYLYLFYTPVFVSLLIAGWTLAQPRNATSSIRG